tara:strand:+ start:212 stop:376 length:165 start_codon:yes stop_codon:yes gene_type:complete
MLSRTKLITDATIKIIRVQDDLYKNKPVPIKIPVQVRISRLIDFESHEPLPQQP